MRFHSVTEGTSEYTTCSGLLTASTSAWPETALFQIAANGVTLDKLLIGKPATTSDASNGYIDPSTLASCVSQAASQGWGQFEHIIYITEKHRMLTENDLCRCWCDGLAGDSIYIYV